MGDNSVFFSKNLLQLRSRYGDIDFFLIWFFFNHDNFIKKIVGEKKKNQVAKMRPKKTLPTSISLISVNWRAFFSA